MPNANNKDSDQPAHLRSLISIFVVRCLDNIIPWVSISKISSLHLASVAVHASFESYLVENHKGRFSCDEAHVSWSCGSEPVHYKEMLGQLAQSAAHLTAIQEVTSLCLGPAGHITFLEIGHEIIFMSILSLQLIQAGQLSVTGKRMCT